MGTQRTKSGLVSAITSVITTNGAGDITGVILNTLLDDFTESLLFNNGTYGIDAPIMTQSVTASSGQTDMFKLDFTINQTGSAGYNAMEIQITETATGSGAGYGLLVQKDAQDTILAAKSDYSIEIHEATAPSTPSTNQMYLYAKTDGKLYCKNDSGTEYDLTNTSSFSGNNFSISESGTTNDAQVTFDVNGAATYWSIGIDNSAADGFAISASSSLGTSSVLTATTTANTLAISASGLEFTNSSTTGASLNLTADNATGDPKVYFQTDSDAWAIGIDNSASDQFKISSGGAIGTGDVLRASTNANPITLNSTGLELSRSDGSNMQLQIESDNTAGDALIYFNVNGSAAEFSLGIDNSDDFFHFSLGTTLGTNDMMYFDDSGVTYIEQGLTVNATTTLNSGAVFQSSTVAGLPAATAGKVLYVSNESGGAVLAFADGTNWRRVTDRAIVS